MSGAITYGDAKGNDALLQYYGFVEAGNRADRAWLESAALGLDRATGGSEEGLVAVGGASVLEPPAAAAALLARCGGDAAAAAAAVAAACADRLAAMPTTLADDEATLGGSALPTRHRLALQWRIEKKRILARVAKG